MKAKNKMLKKIISLLLCITVVCGAIPFFTFEADAVVPYKKGDIFEIGSYPQSEITNITGLTENVDYVTFNSKYYAIEPIKWVLLDADSGLCVTQSSIDDRNFNDIADNDYEGSEIRDWLTGYFYDSAFTSNEKTAFAKKDIITYYYSENGESVSESSNVRDEIFLLSAHEAINTKLFANDEARLCKATDFTKSKAGYISNDGYGNWWLRSPINNDTTHGTLITPSGNLYCNTFSDVVTSFGIRPAAYLDFTSEYFSFEVTLAANDGTDETTTQEVFGYTSYYPDCPFTNGDFPFTYWYKDAECTEKWTTKDIIDSDITLYAGWKYNPYERGDVIKLGSYPQSEITDITGLTEGVDYKTVYGTEVNRIVDSYFAIEPIEWIVLDPATGLCISKNNLIAMKIGATSNDYLTSEVRTWLYGSNGTGTFYSTAFTNAEKSVLLQKNMNINEYDEHGFEMEVINTVNDKVFLLSAEDATNTAYFPDTASRITSPTDYALCYEPAAYNTWWLRNPSGDAFQYAVMDGGGIRSYVADIDYFCVRPAIYVDFEADMFKYTVTLSANDGTNRTETHTTFGYTKFNPDCPFTNNGYSFNGWYTDKECTQKWTKNDIVKGNMTLYASWEYPYKHGDTISFGSYPQTEITDITGLTANVDYKTLNGKYYAIEPIEWIVLNPMTGLCVSRYALDVSAYNTSQSSGANYSSSAVRSWLYGSSGAGVFYNSAFNSTEKSVLLSKDVVTYKYDTWNGKYTSEVLCTVNDKVFLLDEKEVTTGVYFSNDSERKCSPTDYAIGKDANISSNGNSMWWLRSPTFFENSAGSVNADGNLLNEPEVDNAEITVRPAIYLNIISDYFKCEVTLDANNDSGETQTHAIGNSQNFYPDCPFTNENIAFKGWYRDAQCTQKWNKTDVVTENMTLYAGWDYHYRTGDIIKFGSFPKSEIFDITGLTENVDYVIVKEKHSSHGNIFYTDRYFAIEPIEWIVINKDTGLCLCKDAITTSQFHFSIDTRNIYANSDLRAWLIGDFYNNYFTNTEKTAFLEKDIVTYKYNSTTVDSTLHDKIFVLSVEEARSLSGSELAWSPTAYAKAREITSYPYYQCWLRSPGDIAAFAAFVSSAPYIDASGNDATNQGGCVRPAAYLDLESEAFISEVTLVANNGTNNPVKNRVCVNQTYYPECPFSREGYYFSGWYRDKKCTQEWTESDTIKGNISLYAGWTKYKSSSDLFKETIPTGFDESDTSNPYGLNSDSTAKTLVSPVNELLVYKSADTDTGASTGLFQVNAPDFAVSKLTSDGDGNSYRSYNMDESLIQSTAYAQNTRAYVGNGVNNRYARMVGLDMYGTGRKDSVAVVSMTDSEQVYIYIYRNNGSGNYALQNYSKVGDATWMNNIAQAKINNYIGITAGDYDNDNCDEVAVFASLDNGAYVVRVYEANRGDSGSMQYHDISTDRLTNDTNGTSECNKVTGSLASGDIDGDGVDDLVVCMGSNKRDTRENTYGNGNTEHDIANVTVYKDYSFGDGTFDYSKIKDYYLCAETSTGSYDVIPSADVAVGDIDGDGDNEIVTAGYKCTMTISSSKRSGLYDFDTTYFAMHIYDFDRDIGMMSSLQMTALQSGGLRNMNYDNSGTVKTKLCVECVALGGFAASETVFVSGSFYNISNGNPTLVYTVDGYDEISASGSNRIYVESTSVGNFNGDLTGTEQIYFTAAKKDSTKYSYQLIFMGYDSGKGYYSVYTAAGKGTNCINDSNYDVKKQNDESTPGLNFVPCAVDVDNDGLTLGYAGKSYSYSDPDVITVLQAAPYFDELNDYYVDPGETSYSCTTSYSRSKTSGNNVSFGVGLSIGFEAEFLVASFEDSYEIGYSLDWEESFEEEWETSYTTTFSAAYNDTVVIQRTPVFIYGYKIWNSEAKDWYKEKDGSGRDSIMYLSIPQQPIYYQLSIAEYNDYVDQYNSKINGKENAVRLSKITDSNVLPRGSEGNPGGYYSMEGQAGYGWENLSKNTYYAFSHNGGGTSSEWEKGYSMTSGSTMSHGFHFSASSQAKIAGVKIGGYVELDYNHSTGSYVTSSQSEGASGMVAGVSVDEENGFTREMAERYSFNWTFGKWMRSLQTDSNGNKVYIPVFGYIVTDLNALPAPVSTLEADGETGVVTLTWNGNSDDESSWRGHVKGYNVYIERDDGYEQINDYMVAVNADNSYSFTYSVTEEDGIFINFIVRAIQNETGMEGVYSNVANAIAFPQEKKIINIERTHSETGGERFIFHYDDGTSDVADISNKSNTYELAKSECYYDGTEEQWNALVSEKGSVYKALCFVGFEGTEEDFARLTGCSEGHIYKEYRVDARCESVGFSIKICKICGSMDFNLIAAQKHSYEEEIIAPDCVQRGYTVCTCSKCGMQHVKDFVPATGHAYVASVTAPTCTCQGYTTHTCSVCNNEYRDSYTNATGHHYGSWVTMVKSTCTETGFKYHACEDCGFTEINMVTPNGHQWKTEYTVDKEPTCTDDGSESIHCSECDAIKESRVIPRKGHTFSEWTITENPTATHEGKMKRSCSECGFEEEETIPTFIPDYPTSVTLNKSSVTLSLGDSDTLTATISPVTATDKNVTWSTSDSSVATVSEGVITTVAPGFALITVSTVDDRYVVCKATCSVYVTALDLTTSSADVDVESNLISGISPNLNSLDEYLIPTDGCTLEYSTPVIGTGTTVNVIHNGEVVDTYTAVVFGDTTGDSWYDGMDAMIVNCIVNGMLTKADVGEAVWTAADCNHDGVIDEADVELLNQAGLLLSQVDQNKSKEELQLNSVYQEYLGLIDQNVEKETKTTDEQPMEPAENSEQKSGSLTEIIISLFSKIWEYFMGLLFGKI